MSAHFYHSRPTTRLSKSGEQAICWLKLHYYINVPMFIFLTHFWAQSSRSLPSSASTQLSHNHRTHPLPDWCINSHLSVPQRSQRWSYSCLHPVTVVCGHLTIQPSLFSFVQRQEPRDHLFSFPFSHALGMLGSFVSHQSLQPGRVFLVNHTSAELTYYLEITRCFDMRKIQDTLLS